MLIKDKKQVVITGFYGSGKSEFSLNYAIALQEQTGERVNIVDLDIINPYFRTREKESFLKEKNIYILGNALKEKDNSDLPQISADMFLPIHRDEYGIYDLGGTENGLKVIASLKSELEQVGYDLYVIVNVFRDETDDVSKITKYIKMVQLYGYHVTGIINNSNLLEYTTEEDFIHGHNIIKEVSQNLNIDVKYGLIESRLFDQVKGLVEYPLLKTDRILKPYK
jgi:energy-coupling factor transporter ATP-binding protein EcfA2